MEQYNVYDAKTHLSELLTRAQQGEEIVIAKANHPIAKLVAYVDPTDALPRERGQWRGKVVVAPDFDTLPPELAAAFAGD